MSKKLHVLCACDNRHSTFSCFRHGIFSTRGKAIDALTLLLSTAGHIPLSEDDYRNLERFGQTQGYQGEGEFTIHVVPLDEIDVWL